MKSHVQVLVIGGGVVGCSVLYHLTSYGCTDVALCERKQLTAGSSWHAAGLFHALNSQPAMARLQAYTISLYPEIQELSGQPIGLHYTGGLNVAATRDRWEFLRADCARHRVLGLDTELIGPDEIRDLWPMMDTTDVLGALYDPKEGHLDPSGATHAYAKAARMRGAEIYVNTRVLELKGTGRGSWLVVTDRGSIEAEHVVNAGGLWAREVGHLVGAQLPLLPMEHHYLITEDLPELVAATKELPLVVDLDGEMYLRQERNGLLLGVYEEEATPWAANGTPWDFGDSELLASDLDRIAGALERGFRRFPALQAAGIRKVVNGPFTFTPDGNPLVGPLPGIPNYWTACGVMAGFAQGGGVGLVLAHWITNGEPEGDILALDVARFGEFANKEYVAAKAREFYARRFRIAYPNEYWPAGRPSNTSSLFERLRNRNAVHGVSYGLEYPLYFARTGDTAEELPSLRRSNAFEQIGTECVAARSAAGVLDASSFAKFEFSGPGAATTLDYILAAKLPSEGSVRLTPMLARSGRLMGDLVTACLASDRYMVFGSGYLQAWHLRWFQELVPRHGVTVRNLSGEWGGIAVFGPRSRQALSRIADECLDNDAFPFMTARMMPVGSVRALVMRLSVTGELGYEIHAPRTDIAAIYDQLMAMTPDLGIMDVGMYSLLSLRIEKAFGIWSREYSSDYLPAESGLARFVAYDKADFVGRSPALSDRDMQPARRLMLLEVEATDADASFCEPVWSGDERVGFVTSAAFGHTCGRSLALGYLSQHMAEGEMPLEVTVVGSRRRCRVLAKCPVDPDGVRMRS